MGRSGSGEPNGLKPATRLAKKKWNSRKNATASLCSLERVVRRRLVGDNLDATGTLLGKKAQTQQRLDKAEKLGLPCERRKNGCENSEESAPTSPALKLVSA